MGVKERMGGSSRSRNQICSRMLEASSCWWILSISCLVGSGERPVYVLANRERGW